MDPWIYQMGLPVVDITEAGSDLQAIQERFMNDPDADKDQPESPYEYVLVSLALLERESLAGTVEGYSCPEIPACTLNTQTVSKRLLPRFER